MYLKGTDQYPFSSEPSVKGLSITQVDSAQRICPSKQRVFHHLVKQLRKPDIKLIPSLVSCRYREGMTRKHPAVDSYPSSSLSNWYQPIPISSGYFPVYMYLSIDSRRAESRGRCAIPSIHLCGFLFCSRFGLFLQHV